MKFKELIKTNNWLSVELTLLSLYPDQIDDIGNYRKIYLLLQQMDIHESNIEIVVEQEFDEENNQLGIGNVYGIDYESKNEITNAVTLEFTSWNTWLGMEINKLTQKEFTELEIISHCLNEMTYAGYKEEEIQAEFLKIKNIQNQYYKDKDKEK